MELGWMALIREGPVNHSRGSFPAELTAQETFPGASGPGGPRPCPRLGVP